MIFFKFSKNIEQHAVWYFYLCIFMKPDCSMTFVILFHSLYDRHGFTPLLRIHNRTGTQNVTHGPCPLITGYRFKCMCKVNFCRYLG